MAQALVDKEIKDHPVMIFSKSFCPYCDKVKALFKSIGVEYTAMELDKRNDGNEIQNELKNKTGATTVPRVFIAGEHIGGCDDTHALQKNGGLATKLKAAGVLSSH